MKIAFINNQFIPKHQASLSIEDRATQFSDGVYEVIETYNGQLVDLDEHLISLNRSLKELAINYSLAKTKLEAVFTELKEKNYSYNLPLYIQISRGTSPRNHIFSANIKPNLTIYFLNGRKPDSKIYENGVQAILLPDNRWQRRDIKSTSLLGNIVAKNKAKEQGAFEAIFSDNGIVLEGSSTNIFIVNKKGELQTHPKTNKILWGITREKIIQLAQKNNIKALEKEFTEQELFSAKEVFLTSTTTYAIAITKINGKEINSGKVGGVYRKIFSLYSNYVHENF
jgi:D-alanine transaminase